MDTIDAMVDGLAAVRDGGGRLFILGVGGGAGHASHAVNDFRKICAPRELRADRQRLRAHRAHQRRRLGDGLRRLAARLAHRRATTRCSSSRVGGGSREHGVSTNLVAALDVAREVGAKIYGIVGKPDGETARVADACVVVPAPAERRTPQVEAFQAVVWHLIVSHPAAGRAGRQVGVASADDARRSFVDRDGVINEPVWDARTESFESPYRPEDVALVPGRRRGLARLRDAGFKLVLVSNQPAAAKGQVTLEASPPCMNGWSSCCVRRAWSSTAPTTATTTRTSPARATAASRRPGCCSPPPPSWSSTSARAG